MSNEEYDSEAMALDISTGNFNPTTEDPDRYRHERIVADSIYNGQFTQAREQCARYGLDYDRELWVNSNL